MATLAATIAILAQTTGPATRPAADLPWWGVLFQNPLVLFAVVMMLFLFLNIRGNKNKEKQRQEMLSTLKKGDRIQTIGGILGTVVETREGEVLVKVDESNNTKMWFVRSAIHKTRTDEKK